MSKNRLHFDFAPSAELSLGVELELQIIDVGTGDLAQLSRQLLTSVGRGPPIFRGAVVPEVTAGMIEISTGICTGASAVLADLTSLHDRVAGAAGEHNAQIAGGGMHPFARWPEQQISSSSRYEVLSALYGQVLKQTTVFGQHIHMGCADVRRVPLLMHQLSRFVPHLIAMSASSPFMEGYDTGFDSTRLNCPDPFPTSPGAPFTLSWDELTDHLAKWLSCGVIDSIKDLHWDIRPKPEFGTVEIRVLDSPLTLRRAASLAGFAQLLGNWLLIENPFVPCQEDYVVYTYNKFQATRFGLGATYIDPVSRKRLSLSDHLTGLLHTLCRYTITSEDEELLAELRELVRSKQNGASELRGLYRRLGCLKEVALLNATKLASTDVTRAGPLATSVTVDPISPPPSSATRLNGS
ncbi:carboxylate-amine ligase [Variovorax boronicumulans]|uniref:YbdK family carboxylate-amine ligase n=1 Tax=Variovorax boronicumulans TaxID=436515 RepID=UPI002475D1A5|nr:YbdK family carboxylate-amine ligase [Variovorax boronicumulans]MDH6170042.1 carboxylate-amine ligase [Variovorax boronicumulans]